ncbi:MAG: hypothetical protein U0929_04845 [Planctomycetaceae bacterium]
MVCTMIIPDAIKPLAEATAAALDPLSEGVAFATPLRLVGSTTVTHWSCSPNLTDTSVIAAIRTFAASQQFAGGIYYECPADNVRNEYLALVNRNGLEENPVEVE